jgi:transcription elongation GreA/GreB family factor
MAFTAGTTLFTQASQFLTDVELYNEETGSSYELTILGTDDLDVVFSSNSVDVTIPQ